MSFRNWRYYWREALTGLWRNGWLSLASAGIVAITLIILGASLLMVVNVNNIASTVESKVEISVFLKDGMSSSAIADLGRQIAAMAGVSKVEFISKEQALQKLRKELGSQGNILQGVDMHNPLPDAYQVKVREARQVAGVAEKIKGLNGVDQVRYGQEVVEKLIAVTRWLRVLGLGVMVLLAVAAVFLIATTIRLTVFARRREIHIMKFIGATDWFIRWPFLLEGMAIGLLGSALAVLLLYLGYAPVIARIKGSLPFIPLVQGGQEVGHIFLGLMAAGLAIGALGSVVSVRRFLKV